MACFCRSLFLAAATATAVLGGGTAGAATTSGAVAGLSTAVLAAPSPAAAAPARWVSFWFSPAHPATSGNVSATLALLAREGGSKLATSLFVYCEDKINLDGSFTAGVSAPCDKLTVGLAAMGIGTERIVGASSIANLRAMFKSPDRSITGLVALARKSKLRGISWDIEPANSTRADAKLYAAYLKKLRAALQPVGARLTTYNNEYDPVISDFNDLQHSVDRLLDGDTCVEETERGREEWWMCVACCSVCVCVRVWTVTRRTAMKRRREEEKRDGCVLHYCVCLCV